MSEPPFTVPSSGHTPPAEVRWYHSLGTYEALALLERPDGTRFWRMRLEGCTRDYPESEFRDPQSFIDFAASGEHTRTPREEWVCGQGTVAFKRSESEACQCCEGAHVYCHYVEGMDLLRDVNDALIGIPEGTKVRLAFIRNEPLPPCPEHGYYTGTHPECPGCHPEDAS